MCESNSLTVAQLIAALAELPPNAYVRQSGSIGWVRNVTTDDSTPWRKIVTLDVEAPEDDEKYDRLFAPVSEVTRAVTIGEKVYASVAA